ncbi:MAG: flagellar basal-body MS-ring/collar protein FliF [Candidatus Margulisiibacteriota bacterium]
MGEPVPAGFDIRRMLLLGGVAAVVIFSLLFFVLRGCVSSSRKGFGYTIVYSNMTLKDAANSIARLKEIGIPYEIREDGKAIAVPKEKADQARLGLAEKNLPAGGVVGWEIFDQSKLGATDFDRRIQLIRAISGELSRTIRGIEGVEEAHVQIVIPETRLFAETVTPVTASVMLRLRSGAELGSDKINGIIHLVASSVENLQVENVTVVDSTGKILSARPEKNLISPELPEQISSPVSTATIEAVLMVTAEAALQVSRESTVIIKNETPTASVPSLEAVEKPARQLTPEDKALLLAQAKKNMEIELAGKAQEILNRFYPPNSVIIKVTVDIKPPKKDRVVYDQMGISKVTAIVLIDNRIEVSKSLKQSTYKAVAAATGYNQKRGDRIVLQKVPFHLASSPETVKVEPVTPIAPPVQKYEPKTSWFKGKLWLFGFLAAGIASFFIYRAMKKEPRVKNMAPAQHPEPTPPPAYNQEKITALDSIRSAVERNPEQIAQMLRKWLSE